MKMADPIPFFPFFFKLAQPNQKAHHSLFSSTNCSPLEIGPRYLGEIEDQYSSLKLILRLKLDSLGMPLVKESSLRSNSFIEEQRQLEDLYVKVIVGFDGEGAVVEQLGFMFGLLSCFLIFGGI
ncbi:hypothetical protein Droror1_Dr00026518 [Drosera rotundifolia]